MHSRFNYDGHSPLPLDQDPQVLERLAGVAPGTYETLQIMRAAEKALLQGETDLERIQDIGYAFYQVTQDHDVGTLDDFILFGWGRFDLSLLPAEEQPAGATTDPETAAWLLASATNAPQDLQATLAACKGVCWS